MKNLEERLAEFKLVEYEVIEFNFGRDVHSDSIVQMACLLVLLLLIIELL
ncbi:hypothetical protein HZB88_01930 [archaeon]|nr:hypothetical protein [archaeon]